MSENITVKQITLCNPIGKGCNNRLNENIFKIIHCDFFPLVGVFVNVSVCGD